MGRLIGMLDGRYIAAPDVGIGVDDLRVFLKVSPWVCGASTMAGPSAPYTALGVFAAMKAAVKHHLKEDSLSGLKVALQGIGSVGSELAGLLATNGAELFVADIDEKAVHSVVKQYGASVLSVEEILNADVDVLSPNALGGVLNASTIPGIRASIICGAANNQLAEDGDGWLLHKKGIVFCPDYVVSAGGLIAGMEEFSGFDLERARQRILAIGKTIEEILALAEEGHVPQSEVAAQIARSRIAQWTWTLPPAAPETSASSPAGMTRPRLQLDACEQKRS
jgi:leucine dehydrogenase